MCAPKELTSQAAIMAIDGGTCCKPIGVCVFYGRPTLGNKDLGTFVPKGNEPVTPGKPGSEPSDPPQKGERRRQRPPPASPFPEGTELDVDQLPTVPNIDVGGGVFY